MTNMAVVNGIIVGAVGGSFAGLTVWTVQLIATKVREASDKRKVYKWLKKNTSNKEGDQYRSTRAIASWTNLTTT